MKLVIASIVAIMSARTSCDRFVQDTTSTPLISESIIYRTRWPVTLKPTILVSRRNLAGPLSRRLTITSGQTLISSVHLLGTQHPSMPTSYKGVIPVYADGTDLLFQLFELSDGQWRELESTRMDIHRDSVTTLSDAITIAYDSELRELLESKATGSLYVDSSQQPECARVIVSGFTWPATIGARVQIDIVGPDNVVLASGTSTADRDMVIFELSEKAGVLLSAVRAKPSKLRACVRGDIIGAISFSNDSSVWGDQAWIPLTDITCD